MDSPTISRPSVEDTHYYARGREVFIRLSLLALMGVSCMLLLRPFLNLIICGIIVAIGIYPAHRMLTKALRGRAKLSAALCVALLLLAMILPSVLLMGTLIDGMQAISHQVQAGQLNIPPPPPSLEKLPVIGPRLQELWTLCSSNLDEVVRRFGPQIQKAIPAVLSATAGIGGAILQFFLAIVLTGFLLATGETNRRFADKVFLRIFGDQGLEFKDLVSSTVRTVTNGILGVAIIQTLCATLGFWLVGLPAVGLWALLFLVAAILQMGVLVLLPAIVYAFAAFSTKIAVIFLVWCIFVGVIDNILKPILLGRGGKVPMLVILLGVLGGFIAMNSLIGLFVGAIVLAVGYKLVIAWLDSEAPRSVVADAAPSVPQASQ